MIGLCAEVFFARYHLRSKHAITKNLLFLQELELEEPTQENTDTLGTAVTGDHNVFCLWPQRFVFSARIHETVPGLVVNLQVR